MQLTIPLLNKGSFLASLINKCRQVVRIKPVNNIESNIKPNISNSITTPKTLVHGTQTSPASSILETNRPVPVANICLSRHAYATKTLEEKAGLPPRPKKPLTPYFRYMNENRPRLLAANPKVALIEIVKQISKEWESVDASLKQRLQEEYKNEQQKYTEIRTKYDAKITDEQRSQLKMLKQEQTNAKEKRMMRKRVKQLGKPKKPPSAFLLFISKERTLTPQLANETFRDWHKKTTARWGTLPQDLKDVYMMESRIELEKYKKQISLWEEKMLRLGHIDVVRHSNLIEPPESKKF